MRGLATHVPVEVKLPRAVRDPHAHGRSDRSVHAVVSVVVPALNEEKNLPALHAKLQELMTTLGVERYEMVVVDDGSTDRTLDVLRELSEIDPRVKYVSLTRNFGHQAALRAGIDASRGDCLISMDADLQHPPRVIVDMLAKWREGFDVVSTIRVDAGKSSIFKRTTGGAFYRIINMLGEHRIEPGSADFFLIDRSVVDAIRGLPETELFFRGLLPWMGFKTVKMTYEPDKRLHGTSKYSVRKMVRLGMLGVLSTSVQPLRLAIVLAMIVAGLTLVYAAYAIFAHFYFQHTQPGWASVIVVVSLIGAMQLFVLGIIGEYLGRVLRETRGRPGYLVRDTNTRRDEHERGGDEP